MATTETRGRRRQRVPALPPEDRRAAVIEATIPLLREHGLAVSTRQIADAAGVAEGTIFGVFPDKLSLVRAALTVAFDPGPVLHQLDAIGDDPRLRFRLIAAARVISGRIASNAPLLAIARGTMALADLASARNRIVDALAALIEPDRDQLRRPPITVARLLLSMVFASAHGVFGRLDGGINPQESDPQELVSLLLDGLLVREARDPRESTDAH